MYLKSELGNYDMGLSLFLSSFAAIVGGIEAQAAQMKEISSADSAELSRKIVSIYQSF